MISGPLAAALLMAVTAAPAKGKAARARARPRGSLAEVQPPAGAPLPVRVVGVRPLNAEGMVRSATRQRGYLDAGAREGLAVGQVLSLSRKGQPVAQCTVEAVSDRSATCLGAGVRAGDAFAVNPRAAGALPTPLPPRPSPEEQGRRLLALQGAAFVPIEFKGKPAGEATERIRRTTVGVSHVSYVAIDARGLHQEQVYATVRDAEVFSGRLLNLDLAAVYRTTTSPNERFQEGKQALFWLREASLTFGPGAAPWRLVAGRVLPLAIPGGSTFDGVQAGWRPVPGTELGLFGGGVPDPVTTTPGLNRATAGGYGSWEAATGKSLFRQDVRVAYVKLPDRKSRLEAEATAQAWIGRRLDVSAQARVGVGDYAAPGKLDGARVDLGWHQPGSFSLAGGLRYDENRIPDAAAPAILPGRTRHAWGSATWERLGWLQIRATGGMARDVASGNDRTWAGPELVAPRLLGRWGGMAAGYSEEMGYLKGRSAWVQSDLVPGHGARLLARASWFMDVRPAPLAASQNFGLLLSGAADLNAWLRIRLSALARLGMPLSDAASTDWGTSAFVSLEARY